MLKERMKIELNRKSQVRKGLISEIKSGKVRIKPSVKIYCGLNGQPIEKLITKENIKLK